MELHDHSHLRDAHRDENMFVILSWSLDGASLEPSNQTCIFSTFVCHHAPYSWRHFLDVWVRFGLRRSHIWGLMVSCHSIFDLPYIWCHIEAYFHFDWDLQIFMELHAHPHLWDTDWDDDPPVESLWSYPIRSVPFGTYMSSCFLLGYAFLICGSDSVMDSGDQDCIVDDWWFDVSWSFRPVTHSMPYWGIFALSIEICRSPWICMIIPSYDIHVRLMIRFHFVPIL